MRPLDLTGQRFGKLVAVRIAEYMPGDGRLWECVCDCGGETKARTEYLRCGDTKSCGCLIGSYGRSKFTTHGMSKVGRSNSYVAWVGMKGRCLNPNDNEFHRYGGRGITVCERWLSYENFLLDMGLRPSLKHSIDRIDPNGNYEPSNCRWANAKQQARNTRRTIRVLRGGRLVVAQEVLDEALANAFVDGVPLRDFLLGQGVGINLTKLSKHMDGRISVR